MLRPALLGLVASSLFAFVAGCSTGPVPDEESATESALAADAEPLCPGSCDSGNLRGNSLLTSVNRRERLRKDWAPTTEPIPEAYLYGAPHSLRPTVVAAFIKMADAARASAGIELLCTSGYRSFDRQCVVFNNYAAQDGCEEANTFSARAGHSEHQLGTVCDIAEGRDSGPFLAAGSAADRWLTANAWKFGFANSYPHEDRALNDGYVHEPWHYRFIGQPAAARLHDRGRVAVPVFISSLSPNDLVELEAAAGVHH